MNDAPTFDLSGDLPRGTTVLEASAGTGKTFTIAGLVTRWVAETDLRLPRILVVTFTRAATAELRDRVRRRLVDAGDHLERALAGAPTRTDDPVLLRIGDGDRAMLERRHQRVSRALTDVDVATISTIHGFCQHVLDGLGIASDLDRDAELVEDQRDLVEEVVDDLLVATYHDPDGDRPRIGRPQLLALGHAVVSNPTTGLHPAGTDEAEAALRLHLASRIREEVARRSRSRRMMSYDDLLTRLERTLRDPDRAGAARASLRQRYRVALIDEFQDTDPVQWSIVSRAFTDAPDDVPERDRGLVLIGDPKQAIYAFRGADVHSYLDASRGAAELRTLRTNWRSDAGLLQALDTLLTGATFGDPRIRYRTVVAAPDHQEPRLVGAPVAAPLRIRLLPRHDDLDLNRGGLIDANQARQIIAQDTAADIVRLLSARPTVPRGAGAPGPLAPRDVAVLVRNHREAAMVQAALTEVDVPSVISGVDSVFDTEAATDWMRLLDALERPASGTRTRALALSAWIGWNGDRVASASEHEWDRLHDEVHRWAELLRERGVATMLRTLLLQRGARARLLGRRGGERLLADLEHIGELLHAAATADHLGVAALAAWLRERMAEAGDDSREERLRRLETDDEAVQILTIHRSKGLEFPVVYCPYLWSSNVTADRVAVFHDDVGRRRIDVGGHAGTEDSRERAQIEARGEELRLVYVALTRARHQVVVSYAPAGKPEWSGLGRLLLCRDDDGTLDCDRAAPTADDDGIRGAADRLATRAGGTVAVETIPSTVDRSSWLPPDEDLPELDRARFHRTLDTSWRRTSYSGLTRIEGLVDRVGSEPAEVVTDDETIGVALPPGGDDPTGLRGVALPLAALPGGTAVGTLVHRILEHVDLAAADLRAELSRVVGREPGLVHLGCDPQLLVDGLAAAVETPLGPDVDELRLRDLTRHDRRDEMEFELPLDRDPGGRTATIGDLLQLMRDHLAADDPLRRYPDHVPEELLARDLRGYLNGSIDLVLRRHDDRGAPSFSVVDHKTNRLAIAGDTLTAWHYRPEALADAMAHGHYPLQALLYTVALHRWLRWRLPGYTPEAHLGPVLYTFVRGMIGAETPRPDGRPCGVFSWRVPPDLVVAASDLLHGKLVPA